MYKEIPHKLWRGILGEFTGYALHDQFYKAGAACFIFYVFIAGFTIIVFGKEFLDLVVKVFLFFIICTCTFGAFIEVWVFDLQTMITSHPRFSENHDQHEGEFVEEYSGDNV